MNTVRPVPVKKKRLIVFMACKETGSESNPILKKTQNYIDNNFTIDFLTQILCLSFPHGVSLNNVSFRSATLPVFYIAACKASSGFASEKCGRGWKRRVQDLLKAIKIILSRRSHFSLTREDVRYV